LSNNKCIADTLQQIVEELILFDPANDRDFKHLLELIEQLEQSIPEDKHRVLLEHLEQVSASESSSALDEAIKEFQSSVENLISSNKNENSQETEVPAHPNESEQERSELPPYFEDADLLRDFLAEGEDHLKAVENNLIDLETNPENAELLDAIFRPFHTIKGVAGFLNIEEIQRLAHEFENYLDAVRSHEIEFTTDAVSLVLEGVDAFREIFNAIQQGLTSGTYVAHTVNIDELIQRIHNLQDSDLDNPTDASAQDDNFDENSEITDAGQDDSPGDVATGTDNTMEELDALQDPDLLQDFLQEAEEHIANVEQKLIEWENDPENAEIIDDIFRPFHTIKGVAGFLNLGEVQSLAHEYENLLDQAREGTIKLSSGMTDLILAGVDAFRQMMAKLHESMQAGEMIPSGIDVEAYIAKIQAFQSGDVEPSVESNTSASPADEQQGNTDSTKNGNLSSAPERKMFNRQKVSSSIKVDTEKMDYLIDMVGELVITQNMIAQNKEVREATDKRLLGDMAQFKRITSTLQDIAMSLRMVPIENTFRKMQRIVRDLAHKSGKKIQLKLSGEQTEIDRNMVEALYDPLVHMVRNACDHGIEMPEQRKTVGKEELGTIHLNAFHKGGNIVIEISDNGAGLNKEAIFKKAVERGVVNPDQELTEKQTYELLMQPGFSTAEQVTEVSGRGVGMDVVKRTIEKMRGQIDIESEEGKGSTFYIKLPLTLAIIDGVIVRVGTERFVLPTLSIEESVQPKQVDYNLIAGQGETIKVRGHIFPLIRLHHLFDVANAIENPWEGIVVLVNVGKDMAALMVDELVDKQEIVIKSMGDQLQSLPGISGGAILGDGTVGLILDVPTLLSVRDAKNRESKYQRKQTQTYATEEIGESENGVSAVMSE